MRGNNRSKATAKGCSLLLGAASFFASPVAHATPQLRCPDGMSTHSPPEAVILLVSLLLAAAPLAAGVALATFVLKRGQPGDASKRPTGWTHSLAAFVAVLVGIAGSVLTSLFALFLLVSGAWVGCG